MKPIVIISAGQRGASLLARSRVAELEARGFEACVCVGAAELQRALQTAFQDKSDNLAVLLVLDGDLRSNCASAQLATTLYPQCGVVSLLDVMDEDAIVTILQSGADACYTRQVSASVLSSALYSLLRRVSKLPAAAAAIAPQSGPREYWQLLQQAWVLCGPQDCSLTLTTSERAFLMRLTQQPDMRASYEDLLHATDPACGDVGYRAAQARLGVLVSRLRRKLRQQFGLDLPIKSLHKRGYMFTGQMRPL